ncbi:unnamed protein product [Timema podura]|uniref:PTHB1 N-terminal domain-containing protein n=1 Tax=Timema podura TaxID=61482 RepID=A0ABN7NXK9_TIMPD|nr:unnamed protein product [Timema podura]
MSLFKVRDLWSTQCGVDETFDPSCLCLVNIGGHSNKIIVGSHNGFLRVFQPSLDNTVSGALSGYKAADLLIEMHLQDPILQVAAGKLVSVLDHVATKADKLCLARCEAGEQNPLAIRSCDVSFLSAEVSKLGVCEIVCEMREIR